MISDNAGSTEIIHVPPGQKPTILHGDRQMSAAKDGSSPSVIGPHGSGKTTLLRALDRRDQVPMAMLAPQWFDISPRPARWILASLRGVLPAISQLSFHSPFLKW